MSRMYTVSFTGTAVTAQQDFFEITCASKSLAIHGFELAQSTEVGDAAEEGLSIIVKRNTGGTSGSGGSSATPQPLDGSDAAASFTAEVNNTTKMTAGTITTLHATNWNVRQSPCTWLYTPEQRPYLSGTQRLTVELATTPADSITVSGTIWVEEIG